MTFEAQAAALRAVMRKFGLSAADRASLQYTEAVLTSMANLRKKCLDGPGHLSEEKFSDLLSTEFMRLLHLPTDE